MKKTILAMFLMASTFTAQAYEKFDISKDANVSFFADYACKDELKIVSIGQYHQSETTARSISDHKYTIYLSQKFDTTTLVGTQTNKINAKQCVNIKRNSQGDYIYRFDYYVD